jgi:N-acetyl-anhydromuramyl-L-alanine amidase AmpD
LNEKKYDLSIAAYLDAKNIKSDETYPDQQIAKINQLIKDDKQRLDLAYNEALLKGDELVATKSYEEARAQFLQAQNLKPKELVPQKSLLN